jgi:flavoprotein
MENLIGNKYGSLTVLEFSHASENKKAHFWKCKCDCGKEKIVKGSHLKGGNVKVCSKICPYRTVKPREKVEIISKNIFIIDQNKVTGITTKGVRFYFDKEDYEDVSKHTWGCDGKGYLITAINKKRVYLHHFILGIDDNT